MFGVDPTIIVALIMCLGTVVSTMGVAVINNWWRMRSEKRSEQSELGEGAAKFREALMAEVGSLRGDVREWGEKVEALTNRVLELTEIIQQREFKIEMLENQMGEVKAGADACEQRCSALQERSERCEQRYTELATQMASVQKQMAHLLTSGSGKTLDSIAELEE